MARQVKSQSRRYHSVLRAEQAQDTRRRVLEAARTLFLRRGYGATTINAVAAEAGVSPETIYGSLGGKKGLLEGVIDATITAYIGSLPDPDDATSRWAQVGRQRSAHKRLRAWVEFVCEVVAHTSPIHAVIRGAADGEPFALELRDRLLEARIANVTAWLQRFLGDDLRPGFTIAQAGERAAALLSPELHHLLIVQMGWTPEQHRQWVGDLLESELLRS